MLAVDGMSLADAETLLTLVVTIYYSKETGSSRVRDGDTRTLPRPKTRKLTRSHMAISQRRP